MVKAYLYRVRVKIAFLNVVRFFVVGFSLFSLSTFIQAATENPGNHNERWIPAGTFEMGSNRFHPDESPRHTRSIKGFWMDQYEVTNEMFAAFVKDTAYVTTAEVNPLVVKGISASKISIESGSAVFYSPSHLSTGTFIDWWKFVPGAFWRAPEGPGSSIIGRENHPVVHVSLADARAYAKWAGRSLATESEWEYAASVTPSFKADEIVGEKSIVSASTVRNANVWQGLFPLRNSNADGFAGTAPVGSFEPNTAELYDMIGNVWEWVDDQYTSHFQNEMNLNVSELTKKLPYSPEKHVIKGGSFLCSPDFCARFRPSARLGQESNFGSSHIGFRTIRRP